MRIHPPRDTLRNAKPTELRSPAISSVLTAAGIAGLALVGLLIFYSGAEGVAHAMLALGWWLLPITLFHLLPLSLSAMSWRELLTISSRLNVASITWIRWIRESINNLLPVAGIGGDVAGVRLMHLRGVATAQAAASVVVDITVGVVTQLVFVLAGVTILIIRSTDAASLLAARTALFGATVFVVAIAIFVWFQHRNMLAILTWLVRRLLPQDQYGSLSQAASEIDQEVVATYRRGSAFLRAIILRLASWVAGTGEIWLVTHFLGRSLSLTDAFILESLASGVYAAAFLVPGALGALEGGFVVFGALFGLPADISLSISLAKRVRELFLGLPGLLVWQWTEAQSFLHHGENDMSSREERIAVPDHPSSELD
jgi:putative membrane protein